LQHPDGSTPRAAAGAERKAGKTVPVTGSLTRAASAVNDLQILYDAGQFLLPAALQITLFFPDSKA
jgi:hypothetical protein